MLRVSGPFIPSQMLILILCLSILISSGGCKDGEDLQESKQVHSSGCIKCHEITPDQYHAFPCSDCHHGQERADTLQEAHQNLPTSSNYFKWLASGLPQAVFNRP